MTAAARAGLSLGELFALNSITFVPGVVLKVFVEGRFLQSIHSRAQIPARDTGSRFLRLTRLQTSDFDPIISSYRFKQTIQRSK